MFFRTPSLLPWLYPSLQWRVPTNEKKIYLTFDDGPVPGPTEFVLDQLKLNFARATFFCIGDNIRKHPKVFEQVLQGGHSIGNHTFNHIKGWGTSAADYMQNISLFNEQLNHIGYDGPRDKFRPPYGRITRKQIQALAEYKIIMWDVLTMDYSASLNAEKCLLGAIGATRPGSIVVFHDSVKAEKNLTYVLPRYLEHFSNQGYAFEKL